MKNQLNETNIKLMLDLFELLRDTYGTNKESDIK